jgi:hypothetical protein
VTLTDRDRKLLLAVVPLMLVLAYWFLLLNPKRQAATKAGEDLTRQEQRLEAARQQASAAKGAQTDFAADYAEIVRLGKAIPASVDMPSLLVQLDRAAAGTGIEFTKIATGDSDTGAGAATPPPAAASGSGGTTPADAGGQPAQSQPGAAVESANNAQQTADQRSGAAEQSGVNPGDAQTSTSARSGALPVGGGAAATGAGASGAVAPEGLEAVPLEMEFVGDFFNLASFFHRLKRFVDVQDRNVLVSGRLVTIEGVRYASDTEIFPRVRAELEATVYLSPKAEGATAGATPQGPATTPAGSAGAPTGSTPSSSPAPTAAATP